MQLRSLALVVPVMRYLCFLFCLLFLDGSVSSDFLFVTPQLERPDLPASPANILKGSEAGQTVLLFKEGLEGEKESRFQRQFRASSMIQFVASLRKQAREMQKDMHGKLETADQPKTPFLVYLGSKMGSGGPSVASMFRIYLPEKKLRSDSLLVLAPLRFGKATMEIEEFINQKYFSTLLAHEFFHGIMGDLYGETLLELKARSYSRVSHAAHRVTDEYLAFLEGVAEAMELATLEMFPNEVSHEFISHPGMSADLENFVRGFKKRRLVTARRNKFGLLADGRQRDGELDPPDVLFKTEGVIATLTYRLLFNSRVQNPFKKVLRILSLHKPLTFLEFFKAFCQEFPADRPIALRQFLESTRFITVSLDAPSRYRAYYLSKKAYKQGKIKLEDYRKEVDSWTKFKASLYQRVLEGDLAFDRIVPASYYVADEESYYELDLNHSPPGQLSDFFLDIFQDLADEGSLNIMVANLIRRVEKAQFVYDMDSLEFPESIETILENYHENYLRTQEARIKKRMQKLGQRLYSSFHGNLSLFISHPVESKVAP
jgi:hypothetical protein